MELSKGERVVLSDEIDAFNALFDGSDVVSYAFIKDTLAARFPDKKKREDEGKIIRITKKPILEIIVSIPNEKRPDFPFESFFGQSMQEAVKSFKNPLEKSDFISSSDSHWASLKKPIVSQRINLLVSETSLSSRTSALPAREMCAGKVMSSRVVYYLVEKEAFEDYVLLKESNQFPIIMFDPSKTHNIIESRGFKDLPVQVQLQNAVANGKSVWRLPQLQDGQYFGFLRSAVLPEATTIYESLSGELDSFREKAWISLMKQYFKEDPENAHILNIFDCLNPKRETLPARFVRHIESKAIKYALKGLEY